MDKLILAVAGFAFCGLGSAQAQETTGVEKSLFNVQTGAVGLWVNHEARLADKFALRSEIGIDLWTAEDYRGSTETYFLPSISIEPRWYYNILKRAEKGKNTANNSANFVTIAFEYYPDFAINKPERLELAQIISIIPKWGIRRTIAGSNWNYEVGFGLGYEEYLDNPGNIQSKSDVAIDAHIRIGYTIK